MRHYFADREKQLDENRRKRLRYLVKQIQRCINAVKKQSQKQEDKNG